MGQKISGYVDDELAELISAMADHHNVPEARIVELLLREGVHSRDIRLRILQVEAKLDLIVDGFAEEENAKELMREQVPTALGLPLPDGTTGIDLVDEPFPAFQSLGIRPDEWSGPDGTQLDAEAESDD
jgi:hypothetical protein